MADANPDALEGVPPPRIRWCRSEGTTLYTEVRGSGPGVLVIGAADEDAEIYRGISERLADYSTVITYDRRGTRRSGREDWPGDGSVQHADDAAALLAELNVDDVTVAGFSAGAIVALRLALRHPGLVKTALCFEPGLFHMVPGGAELQQRAEDAVDAHLASHRGDWVGASAALGRAVVDSVEGDSRGLFSPPENKEWFGERADSNAEALLRGDLPLTREMVDDETVASCPVDIRFSYGTASLPIFRDITSHLAAVRGSSADALEGVGHGPFYYPEKTASYIKNHIA